MADTESLRVLAKDSEQEEFIEGREPSNLVNVNPAESRFDSGKVYETLEKFKPALEKIVKLTETALPYLEKYYTIAYEQYEKQIAPYYSSELAELFLGIVLLFFGGNFALTIACYTAIRLSGWDTLKESLLSLWDTYKISREAIDKDLAQKFDQDGDGKLSAAEIAKAMQKSENVNLLTMVLLKALDPNKLMDAMKGIWMVLLSLMATLRSQFAQQITIGANVGNVLQDQLEVYVEPQLVEILRSYNPAYVRWSNFIIVTVSRILCISISMMLARIVAAYHSALKGGDILSKVALRVLVQLELLSGTERELDTTRILIMNSLALYGFYSQWVSGFALSWWLQLILMPFVLLESFLTGISYYAI